MENAKIDKCDSEKAVSEKEEDSERDEKNEKYVINGSAGTEHPSSARGRAYLEKVIERKRTWDYFEINHPKAISDKKLEQLKEKYTRRKTESALVQQSKEKVQQSKEKEEKKAERKEGVSDGKGEKKGRSEKDTNRQNEKKTKAAPNRTVSMPVIEGLAALQVGWHQRVSVTSSPASQRKKSLDLAWDPLTGESLSESKTGGQDTESVDSGRESDSTRKLSSSSTRCCCLSHLL